MIKNSREKTNPNKQTDRKKIMLTDLCPEQKAKVGELMMLMQKQKSNIVNLQLLLKEQKENRVLLESSLLEKDYQLQKYQNEINELKLYLRQKDVNLQQKSDEINRLKQSILKRNQNIKKVDCNTQTTFNNCEIETQTQNKIIKVQQVQTNESIQSIQSTQKIKNKKKKQKKQLSSQKFSESNIHPKHTLESESLKFIHESSYKKLLPPFPTKSIGRNDQTMTYQQLIQKDDQNDNEASKLASAWLEFKKENINKLRKDIEKSKKKVQLQQQKLIITSQSEDDSPTKLQQFYKKLKISSKPNIKQKKDQKMMPNLDPSLQLNMDQQQLNKLLKSTDFKASKVVGKNGKSESTRRSNLDFYQHDLLDLINKIQN